MAKKKPEEAPKGSPAWMATFSDLMNLLLCFFVLLFSMSTVDAEKFQQVIASLQNTISILPQGGSSVGDGQLISSGVRQLEFLDSYYMEMSNSKADDDSDNEGGKEEDDKESLAEKFEQEQLNESENMYEYISSSISEVGIEDNVEVSFTAEYVKIDLSGAILFNSGKADLMDGASDVMVKICKILEQYNKNVIEVEGHTDNVPMSANNKYENNDVLSMYRALTVADFIRSHTSLNASYVKSSGRGEYVPIADNSTAEGRARNRRVEIKIYNSYNSKFY